MATRKDFNKLTRYERQTRYFSPEIKRKLIADLDKGLVTIAEICREYQVSRSAVGKWRHKYSIHYKRGTRQIVEAMSDTRKIQELKKKIKELEQLVGQKQIQIEFYEKMIELTEEQLGIDIKKKDTIRPSDGSGKTGNE